MRFKPVYREPGKDPGSWREVRDSEGAAGKLLVRAVTEDELEKLRKRYNIEQKVMEVTRSGHRLVTIADRLGEFAIEKGVLALIDTQEIEIPVPDETAAQEATKALGDPVRAGDVVKLDGRCTDAVKRWAFGLYTDFLLRVNTIADELAGSLAREEEGLGKT